MKTMSVLLFLLGWTGASLVAAKPNVVVILADDLGYHDLACYGHPSIKTRHLDRLAGEGVRLTSFYAGATVCTPSRMALLTGAYPTRLGWKKGVIGHLMEKRVGLNPEATTMGEVFESEGYRTALSGQWHLGDEPPFRPHRHGFETTYYINKSNNQTDELWLNDEVVEKPFDNRRLTEKFTRRAIDFIKRKDERPFFLYLPYSAPHFPVEAHPDWQGRSKYGVFGDVVEEMDHRIGELMQALKDKGVERETIVVFLSDNGPEPLTKESQATPLPGRKWDALEGGVRVPCIIRWPGVVEPGVTSDAIVGAIGVLPSLARACGITLSDRSPPIDGIDVWGALRDKKVEHPRKDILFWHGSDGFQAIRMGQWKLFWSQRRAKSGPEDSPVLYDLKGDVSESKDVSAVHPEIVREMQALARRRLSEIQASVIPLGKATEQ
jgi:arylsulfatase A